MISVAIPAFKAKFLKDAIKSVISQTYSDFELIIVNDASPEDIRNTVDQFNDDRIRYSENKVNLGMRSVVSNWNECLRRANGDLFVLFSDDDMYMPGFLEEMYLLALRFPDVSVFHCRTRIIDECGAKVGIASLCPECESGVSFIWHRLKGYRLHFASDFCCRTDKLRAVGGFVEVPQGWGSDDLTWSKLANSGGIGYTHKPLFNYRRSNLSISRNGNIQGKLQALCEYEKIMGMLLETVVCSSEDDHDLLVEAKAELPIWIAARKSDQLLASEYYTSLATLNRVIWRWFRYRKLYSLSSKVVIKSLGECAKQLVKSGLV